MLPASSNPRPQSQTDSQINSQNSPWPLALIVLVALYTLAVVVGLLTNIVRPERAYLLFAMPCFVPAIWCGIGFRRSSDTSELDSGLLLSAIGWVLLGLSFLLKHLAIVQAGSDAYASQAPSPLAMICAAIGVLLLLAGAVMSWNFWSQHYNK